MTESTLTSLQYDPAPPLDDLRSCITGTVHSPGEPGWDRVRSPWVRNVDQTPLAVVEVADADDVHRAVRWAVQHHRKVTAQPVGHGANDSLDGVLLLRTRALNSIRIDHDAGAATIGAGVTVGELLNALDGSRWTFLAGSNADPSVVGMTIGGGISWFGRAFGLAAERIISAELVDGTGRRRRVTQADEPELFWAIRGGGGDFGIITSLQIQLVPGPELFGGQLLWPVEQMPEVLRAFREVTSVAPDELSLWFVTLRFPGLTEVPEPLRGKAFASIAACYLGPAEKARELIRPFREVPGVVLDSMGSMPMRDLGQITAEPTDPMPSMQHSMFLDELGEEVIAGLTITAGADSGSPLMVLQVRHLGGAFRRDRPGGGACGQIDEPYLLFALGVPATPQLGQAIRIAFGRLDLAMDGHTDHRTVPNFLEAGGDLGRVWPVATRQRLAAIKQAVDPLDTIRSNRPVTLELFRGREEMTTA